MSLSEDKKKKDSPFLDVIKNRRYSSVWNDLDTVVPAGLAMNYVPLTFF